jgi:hypothetical protein
LVMITHLGRFVILISHFRSKSRMADQNHECVGTLKTGYPRIQALSQDKEQGVHPRAAK